MRRLLRIALPATLLALAGAQAPAQAATDSYLKISGIHGESTDSVAVNQIKLQDWSWSVSRVGARARNTSLSPVLGDLEFRHVLDAASPLLFKAAALGNTISSAKLSVYKTGTTPTLFLEYCLEGVVVRSVQDSSGDASPVETVKLVPNAVEERYSAQSSTGAVNPVFFGWDLVSRTSIGFNDTCGADPTA